MSRYNFSKFRGKDLFFPPLVNKTRCREGKLLYRKKKKKFILTFFSISLLIHFASFYRELTGKLIPVERLDGNQNSRSGECKASRVDFICPWRILTEKIGLESTLCYLHEFQRKVAEAGPDFCL